MKLKKMIVFFSTVLVLLAFAADPLFSQRTTGSLKGKVVLQEDNSPLPNTSISVESPNLMGKRSTLTDTNGSYRFPSLPPGTYTVTVENQGLKTIIREGIIVSVGGTATLDFFMETAEIQESITVVGKPPVIDLEKSGLSTNIDSDVLQVVPLPRNYLQIIQLAPGINTVSDNPTVHGESYWNNQYLIDGVDTTDPASGTSGTTFNFDNIEEIEFGTAGFKAEYGQVMGAYINIVTKSGGNSFSGSVNFNLMDPSFTGENVPDEEQEAHPVKTRLRDYSFTLGGPIIKDKIWFFGSFQYLNNIRERDDVDYDHKGSNYRWMGKISSQLAANHRAVLFAWGDPYDEEGENLDPFWAFETNPRSFGGSEFNVAGLWHWSINRNAFLETKVSRFETSVNLEPTQPDDVPHVFDIFTQQRTGNYTFYFYTDRGRFQAESDLTYFLDNLAGNHEIKAGIEYSYTYERKRLWTVNDGWGLFNVFMGFPLAAVFKSGKEDVKAKSNRFSIYIQDTWNVNERLTINPGARFDYSTGKNDVLETIHDYKTISPRFGFVYALTADKKTTLKGNYARFYENPILFFPDIFHKGTTPLIIYLFNPFTGNHDIPLPGSVTRYDFLNELKSPYVNEFLLGIEREILPNIAVSLTGIYRKTENIIEDVETNLLYENPAMPYIPTGSKDGTFQSVYSVGNPEEAYREYKGIELSLMKRFSNNWMMIANYTLSETKGTVATSFTGFLDSPGDTINREGFLSVDRRHIVKLAANYIFPYGINLGLRYQLMSGLPYTKFLYNPFYGFYGIYETPLGDEDPVTGTRRRYPTQHLFDIRIEKTFKIDKYNFGVYVDVFNLFNSDTPVSFYTSDNPLYESVSRRLSPISARINLRFFF